MKPTTEQLEAGALRDYWDAYTRGALACAEAIRLDPSAPHAAALAVVSAAADRATEYAEIRCGTTKESSNGE